MVEHFQGSKFTRQQIETGKLIIKSFLFYSENIPNLLLAILGYFLKHSVAIISVKDE